MRVSLREIEGKRESVCVCERERERGENMTKKENERDTH